MPGNKNSGPRCSWFIERCAEIIDEEKLIDFVGRVAAGKETEERLVATKTAGVERLRCEVEIKDRLIAFKMLAEWGIGKPGLIPSQLTPEDSKRTADEYFQSVKRLEEDALNRFRASRVVP